MAYDGRLIEIKVTVSFGESSHFCMVTQSFWRQCTVQWNFLYCLDGFDIPSNSMGKIKKTTHKLGLILNFSTCFLRSQEKIKKMYEIDNTSNKRRYFHFFGFITSNISRSCSSNKSTVMVAHFTNWCCCSWAVSHKKNSNKFLIGNWNPLNENGYFQLC